MSTTIPFGDFRAPYVPAAFEPEIRNRVLAGKTVAVIAEELGADRIRLHNFVSKRASAAGEPKAAPVPPSLAARRRRPAGSQSTSRSLPRAAVW